jgi:23S rRNA (cytidine1920-2'-O)/16S rRNA (cytidine1409-2'-O)-methyltransferase
VITPLAELVVLVKPQIEVGRAQVGRGGIVRDPALHLQVLRDVAQGAQDGLGYGIKGVCPSPILGSEGNREFFLHLRAEGPPLRPEALEAALAEAAQA